MGAWHSTGQYRAKIDPERIVREKMKVLRDFYVVDDDNYNEIYKELLARACMHPEYGMERAVDRAAMTLIQGKLGRTV